MQGQNYTSRQTFSGSVTNNALTVANTVNVINLPVNCFIWTFIIRMTTTLAGANAVIFSLWDDNPQVNLLFGEVAVGSGPVSGTQSMTVGSAATDTGVSYPIQTRLPLTPFSTVANGMQTLRYRIRLNAGTATLVSAHCDCDW